MKIPARTVAESSAEPDNCCEANEVHFYSFGILQFAPSLHDNTVVISRKYFQTLPPPPSDMFHFVSPSLCSQECCQQKPA